MKNILLNILLVLTFTSTSLNADSKKPMSNDDFMKQFMAIKEEANNKIDIEKQKQAELDIRIKKKKQELKATRELRKTVDELANMLGVDE